MTHISVEISVTSGGSLFEILSTLRSSGVDLDIIVINSGDNKKVPVYCRKFNAKEIREKCSLLKSRYLGTVNSDGDSILILDETRVPSVGLVNSLENIHNLMVAFPEVQKGRGIINWLDGFDKDLVTRNGNSMVGGVSLIIPRFYPTKVLKEAFDEIIRKLGKGAFERIVAKDDRIIFFEVSNLLNSTPVISKHPLYHINNTNIIREVEKYSRYGRTSRLLKNTDYEFMIRLSDKMRKFSSPRELPLLFLYLLRGLSYEAGYHLGSKIK